MARAFRAFCRAVHFYCALGDRKTEKKSKKKNLEKRRERNLKKKEICRDLVYFLCISVFLVSIYAIQIALFDVQPGSVVHGRTNEGLIPATALRQWLGVNGIKGKWIWPAPTWQITTSASCDNRLSLFPKKPTLLVAFPRPIKDF